MNWQARLVALVLAVAGATAALADASAQTLVVATANGTTSIDPHYQLGFQNIAPLRHVYDPLFAQDERQRLRPALATRWTATGPTTWRIELRPGVRFHDGSPFTSEDVVFSLTRAPNVPNSPASFALYTRAITGIEIIDDLTVDIHTLAPHPTLLVEISTIGMVSRRQAAATTADYNAGRAAIGTGPFRFQSWAPGQSLVLRRNESYWGDRPGWDQVEIRPIANDTARVAALLAGDVDIIDVVPPGALDRLRARADLRLRTTPANRAIYMLFDHESAASPHVSGVNGAIANPLRDARVRLAISLAIDRQLLVDQVLQGQGAPTAQLLPQGYPGVFADIAPPAADLARARALLAEAGHGEGFALTLLGPNARYGNDQQVQQAIAQMLARIGIRARVDSLPAAVAQDRANRRDFGMYLWGISSESGEVLASLYSLLGSAAHPRGRGLANRGGYANPVLDSLIERASAEMDSAGRLALIRQIVETAIRDTAFLTLYHPVQSWAMRGGLDMVPRADGYTLATEITRPGG